MYVRIPSHFFWGQGIGENTGMTLSLVAREFGMSMAFIPYRLKLINSVGGQTSCLLANIVSDLQTAVL